MTKNALQKYFIPLILTTFLSINAAAQTSELTLSQNPKFEHLLNEKRRINASIVASEGYKIQVYTGDSENSKRELGRFKNDYNYLDATIIFNTPSYKVWVGNFKSKIDAQRHLIEIQKKYSNSFIIKPSK
jgi:hypothetical protein